MQHTLRRTNEKTSHPEPADQSLSKPNQTIIALLKSSLTIDNAQQKRPDSQQHASDNEEFTDMASVEEAADDSGQEEDDGGLRRADEVE